MNKLAMTFILVFFTTSVFARFNRAQEKELEIKIFKAEQYLKKSLADDLTLALGVHELLLQVDIKVNKFSLYKDVAGIDQDWNKIKDMQLPSLFVQTDEQTKLKEVKVIQIENIMSHIKELNIRLFTPYDVVSESSFKAKLKEIISANFDYIDKIKLNIELKKTEQYLKDNRKHSIASPELKLDLKKFKGVVPYFWGAVGFLIAIGLVITYVMKSSVNKLKEAVDNKDFGQIQAQLNAPVSQPQEERKDEVEEKKQNQNNQSSESESQMAFYHSEIDRLRKITSINFRTVREMLHLSYRLEEYEHVIVLFEILPGEERKKMYKDMEAEDLNAFKNFLYKDGSGIYHNTSYLLDIIKELSTVISLSSINNDYFYNYYLQKMVNKLDEQKLVQVLQESSPEQFHYILEHSDAAKIGFLFSKSEEYNLSWPDEIKKIDAKGIKEFVYTIMLVVNEGRDFEEVDPRLKTLPFLPEEIETKVLSSLDFDESFKFSNLIEKFSEVVQKSIIDMDFEDIKGILPIFDENYKNEIIGKLPEIVAERLAIQELNISDRTYMLKGKLQHKLMELNKLDSLPQNGKEESSVENENIDDKVDSAA